MRDQRSNVIDLASRVERQPTTVRPDRTAYSLALSRLIGLDVDAETLAFATRELLQLRVVIEARIGRSLDEDDREPPAWTPAKERDEWADLPDAPGLEPGVAATPLDEEFGERLASVLGKSWATRLRYAVRRKGLTRLGQLLVLSRDDLRFVGRGIGPVTADRFGAWRTAQGYGGFPLDDAESLL